MTLSDAIPPPLATARTPRRAPPPWQAIFASSWMNTVPEAAYDAPVLELTTPIGMKLLIVSDPEGVRRVLLDNVANYPKAEIQRRFASLALGDGLLLSEGATWRAHRRIMASAFEPRRVDVYAPIAERWAQAWIARWREHPSGHPVDMIAEMSALTLGVVSEAMFSTRDAGLRAMVGGAMGDALALRPNLLALLPGVPGRLARGSIERRAARAFAAMDAAVHDLIAARAQASDPPDDLLTRLVRARDPEGGEAMTPAEVRDQVVTIFLAGHETTSLALAWTFYVLSQRPEAEARLRAELETVLGGRAPTAADLPRLRYTRAVIEEAMRLYPPLASLFARQAVAADEICGHVVPPGRMVIVSPWIIHRHRGLWDQPEAFRPERFLDGSPPRFAYMPFGAGPRICLGAAFAMMEATLLLAALAQHFDPRLAEGPPVELRHRATLRPERPLMMTLGPR